MTFKEYQYQRPNMDSLSERFDTLLDAFKNSPNAEHQVEVIDQINSIRAEFSTMYNLCHIRHTVNTKDRFYEEENTFFDKYRPNYEALNNKFYEALLQSKHRDQLEAKFW